jgi:superoxide dismutase
LISLVIFSDNQHLEPIENFDRNFPTHLQEGGGEPPEGNLASAIGSEFGSLDKLIAKVQGSGWVVCYFVFELLSLHFVFRC